MNVKLKKDNNCKISKDTQPVERGQKNARSAKMREREVALAEFLWVSDTYHPTEFHNNPVIQRHYFLHEDRT